MFRKHFIDCLKKSQIMKVSITSKKDFLHIFLQSEKLIKKKYIYEMEKEIAKQIFSGIAIEVKIIEKFTLSKQYTPQILFEEYRDSILIELKQYSIFEYNLFRQAKFTFQDETQLQMKVPDSVFLEEKLKDLVRILEKIFDERCGFPVMIDVEIEKAEDNLEKRNGEIQIEQEVAAVIRQIKQRKTEIREEKRVAQEEKKEQKRVRKQHSYQEKTALQKKKRSSSAVSAIIRLKKNRMIRILFMERVSTKKQLK